MTGRLRKMIWLLAIPGAGMAQTPDTILLSRAQAEKIFLDKNVQLLAGKLDISQADARIEQAKLWPNPSVGIDEVNLWATPGQLSMGDGLPPLSGSGFGKNRQLSAQLEQVIITAGKRKKLIALETVSRDMAVSYFRDLMRSLKTEFRNLLTELQYLDLYRGVFVQQITETQWLLSAYERQAETGNINRAEIIRLRALSLELNNELNDLVKQNNSIQKQLTILMGLPANTSIRLSTDDFAPDISAYEHLPLSELVNKAQAARPDLVLAQLGSAFARKTLSYEKALRTPDITFKAGYDRGGNFMYNFVGFGAGIDLPLFNRNQGNIKAARTGVEKAGLLETDKSRQVEAEIKEAYANLQADIAFFRQTEPGYEAELDRLLQRYTDNFKNRNVGMLEFLDFLEAYLDNKKTILRSKKSLREAIEELKYMVGTEIN